MPSDRKRLGSGRSGSGPAASAMDWSPAIGEEIRSNGGFLVNHQAVIATKLSFGVSRCRVSGCFSTGDSLPARPDALQTWTISARQHNEQGPVLPISQLLLRGGQSQ